MSGDVIDMHRWRFTHERHPASKLSDREAYLRALARQKVEDDSRWSPEDAGRRENQRLLDKLIGPDDLFAGGGDAA